MRQESRRRNRDRLRQPRGVAGLDQAAGLPVAKELGHRRNGGRDGRDARELWSDTPVQAQIDKNPSTPPPATLNRRYVFDSFIVGSGNRLAHAVVVIPEWLFDTVTNKNLVEVGFRCVIEL